MGNASKQDLTYDYGTLATKIHNQEIPNFMWEASDVTYPPPVRWCCWCERVGLIWFEKNLYFGGMIYCIIWGILYMIVFFQLMQCTAVQGKSNHTRKRWEFVGHLIVGILGLMII